MIPLPRQRLQNENEDLLYNDIYDTIENIFGHKVSRSRKQDLSDILFKILNEYIEEAVSQTIYDDEQRITSPSNIQVPLINIIISPSFANNPNYNFLPQFPSSFPINSSPLFFQTPTIYQSSNLPFYNPQNQVQPIIPQKSKNKKEDKKRKFKKQKKEKHHKKDTQKSSQKVGTFVHKPNFEFNGIIKFLISNPVNKDSVLVTSSSTFNSQMMHHKNIILYDNDN